MADQAAPPRDAPSGGAGRADAAPQSVAPPHPWGRVFIGLGLTFLGLIVCALLVFHFLMNRPYTLEKRTALLAAELKELLIVNRIPEDHIRWAPAEPRVEDKTRWLFYQGEVRIPEMLSLSGVLKLIRDRMAARGVEVAVEAESTYQPALRLSVLKREFAQLQLIGSPPEVKPAETAAPPVADTIPASSDVTKPPVPPMEELPLESNGFSEEELAPPGPKAEGPATGKPRVAIIVDDGGYGGPVTETVLGLNSGLTLSILPHTPFAEDTARRAAALGFEVMLHMPMETASSHSAFPGALRSDMTAEDMRTLTGDALNDVPGAVGVNNHQGSKLTGDAAAMRLFLEDIKGRGLFFVDSLTTRDSVAYSTAQELGIPAERRDIFLDHKKNAEYIHEKFNQLIALSKKYGSAIAICHFRPLTAELLKERLPGLNDAGVELVHVSELVH